MRERDSPSPSAAKRARESGAGAAERSGVGGGEGDTAQSGRSDVASLFPRAAPGALDPLTSLEHAEQLVPSLLEHRLTPEGEAALAKQAVRADLIRKGKIADTSSMPAALVSEPALFEAYSGASVLYITMAKLQSDPANLASVFSKQVSDRDSAEVSAVLSRHRERIGRMVPTLTVDLADMWLPRTPNQAPSKFVVVALRARATDHEDRWLFYHKIAAKCARNARAALCELPVVPDLAAHHIYAPQWDRDGLTEGAGPGEARVATMLVLTGRDAPRHANLFLSLEAVPHRGCTLELPVDALALSLMLRRALDAQMLQEGDAGADAEDAWLVELAKVLEWSHASLVHPRAGDSATASRVKVRLEVTTPEEDRHALLVDRPLALPVGPGLVSVYANEAFNNLAWPRGYDEAPVYVQRQKVLLVGVQLAAGQLNGRALPWAAHGQRGTKAHLLADLRDFLLSRQPSIQEVHFLGEDGGQQAQNLPSQARRGARDRLVVWIEPAGDAAWLQALPRWDSRGADPVRLTGPRSGLKIEFALVPSPAVPAFADGHWVEFDATPAFSKGGWPVTWEGRGLQNPLVQEAHGPAPAATVAPEQAQPRTRVAWSGRSGASTSAGLAGERRKRFRDF